MRYAHFCPVVLYNPGAITASCLYAWMGVQGGYNLFTNKDLQARSLAKCTCTPTFECWSFTSRTRTLRRSTTRPFPTNSDPLLTGPFIPSSRPGSSHSKVRLRDSTFFDFQAQPASASKLNLLGFRGSICLGFEAQTSWASWLNMLEIRSSYSNLRLTFCHSIVIRTIGFCLFVKDR